jgi:hypothetical protein
MTCVATMNDISAGTPVRGSCRRCNASRWAYASYGVCAGPNDNLGSSALCAVIVACPLRTIRVTPCRVFRSPSFCVGPPADGMGVTTRSSALT